MADTTLKILTICGSLRSRSYNRALIAALPQLAPAGMTFSATTTLAELPHYNHDVQEASGFPAEAIALANALRSADGVVIASPEYNWTIPGTLKNALDWVSRMKDQPFKGKPVSIQSATTGLLGGVRMQQHLRICLTSLDALVLGRPEVLVTFAAQKFGATSLELTDAPTREIIKLHLAALASLAAR